MTTGIPTPNIPSPDPSLATNERLEEAKVALRREMSANREESKGWVEALQILHEKSIESGDNLLAEKIKGAEDKTANLDRVVQTRLAGSETALNAAMSAADKVTQEIKINFGSVMAEMRAGVTKQIETLNEKIDDVKDRLNRVEAMNIGAAGNRLEFKDQSTIEHDRRQNQIAMFGAFVGVAAFLVALGVAAYTMTRPAPLAPAVVYAQPGGVLSSEPKMQRQVFPLVPSWDDGFYRIAN